MLGGERSCSYREDLRTRALRGVLNNPHSGVHVVLAGAAMTERNEPSDNPGVLVHTFVLQSGSGRCMPAQLVLPGTSQRQHAFCVRAASVAVWFPCGEIAPIAMMRGALASARSPKRYADSAEGDHHGHVMDPFGDRCDVRPDSHSRKRRAFAFNIH